MQLETSMLIVSKYQKGRSDLQACSWCSIGKSQDPLASDSFDDALPVNGSCNFNLSPFDCVTLSTFSLITHCFRYVVWMGTLLHAV